VRGQGQADRYVDLGGDRGKRIRPVDHVDEFRHPIGRSRSQSRAIQSESKVPAGRTSPGRAPSGADTSAASPINDVHISHKPSATVPRAR